jgi:hypothetical protein
MTIPWGSIAGWLGNNAGSLLQIGTSLVGANQQKKATQQAVQQSTPIPYSSTSQFGTTAFDPKTRQLTLSGAQNPFNQLFNIGGQQQLAGAYSAPGAAYYGAAPEVARAAAEMGMDGQAAEAANRYRLLTEYAKPEENRMFQRLENNLFARGQMGTSGGGEQYRGFYEAQQASDLQRQLAAQDWAQSRGLSRFNTALGAVGSGQAGQMNQFNIGTGSYGGLQQAFQQLLAQGQLGVGAASGTPGGVALANAQAQGTPWLAAAEGLKQSGAFDALGRWIGSKIPGTGTAEPQPRFGYVDPSMTGGG